MRSHAKSRWGVQIWKLEEARCLSWLVLKLDGDFSLAMGSGFESRLAYQSFPARRNAVRARSVGVGRLLVWRDSNLRPEAPAPTPPFPCLAKCGGPCAVFAAKMVVGFAEVQVKGVCYGQRINHSDYLSRVLRDACNRQLPALILRPEIGRQQTGDSDEMKWLLGDFTDDAVIRRSAESPHSVTR